MSVKARSGRKLAPRSEQERNRAQTGDRWQLEDAHDAARDRRIPSFFLNSASSVSAIFSCLANSLFSAANIEACLFLLAMKLFSLEVLAACSLVFPSL